MRPCLNQRTGRRKKVEVNGAEMERLGDALGAFGAVVFSLDDTGLVSGSPGLRRRFLDILLSLVRPGYLASLQRYRAVLTQATGQCMPVHLIAVEKKEPYRCGVWLIAPETLNAAQRENEEAIDRLRACLAEEDWPTGYEERRLFDFI